MGRDASGDVAVRTKRVGRRNRAAFVAAAAKVDGFIAVIESRTFLQECIRRSARLALPLPIITYSTVFELEQQHSPASPEILIVSSAEAGSEVVINTLTKLSELFPGVPVIVLADKTDPELALTAIRHGARGYIPFTMEFDTRSRRCALFWRAGHTCRWSACLPQVGPTSPRRSRHHRSGRSQGANLRSFGLSSKASRTK